MEKVVRDKQYLGFVQTNHIQAIRPLKAVHIGDNPKVDGAQQINELYEEISLNQNPKKEDNMNIIEKKEILKNVNNQELKRILEKSTMNTNKDLAILERNMLINSNELLDYKLEPVIDKLDNIEKKMATKDDLKMMAKNINNKFDTMATKDDINKIEGMLQLLLQKLD